MSGIAFQPYQSLTFPNDLKTKIRISSFVQIFLAVFFFLFSFFFSLNVFVVPLEWTFTHFVCMAEKHDVFKLNIQMRWTNRWRWGHVRCTCPASLFCVGVWSIMHDGFALTDFWMLLSRSPCLVGLMFFAQTFGLPSSWSHVSSTYSSYATSKVGPYIYWLQLLQYCLVIRGLLYALMMRSPATCSIRIQMLKAAFSVAACSLPFVAYCLVLYKVVKAYIECILYGIILVF